MVWFRVDDTLPFHRKVVAAGNSAMGLWVRAGAWSAQQLTDGFIPDDVAATLGSQRQAEKLVQVGLWRQVVGGYRFHAWEENGRQPTRNQIEIRRKNDAERKQAAREAKQAKNRDAAGQDGLSHAESAWNPSGVRAESALPDPAQPSPSSSYVSQVSRVSDAHERPTDHESLDEHDDLARRVALALSSDQAHARRVIRDVLARASRPPADPAAYVLRAVRTEPHRYRPTDAPPSLDQLCRDHARPAGTCPWCRAQQASA